MKPKFLRLHELSHLSPGQRSGFSLRPEGRRRLIHILRASVARHSCFRCSSMSTACSRPLYQAWPCELSLLNPAKTRSCFQSVNHSVVAARAAACAATRVSARSRASLRRRLVIAASAPAADLIALSSSLVSLISLSCSKIALLCFM